MLLAGSLLSGIYQRGRALTNKIKSICEAHRPLDQGVLLANLCPPGINTGPFYFHTRACVMGMKKGDAHQT